MVDYSSAFFFWRNTRLPFFLNFSSVLFERALLVKGNWEILKINNCSKFTNGLVLEGF